MSDKQTIADKIRKRQEAQTAWLQEHHPEVFVDQKHTTDGTAERAYWHYGYRAALTDILGLIEKERAANG